MCSHDHDSVSTGTVAIRAWSVAVVALATRGSSCEGVDAAGATKTSFEGRLRSACTQRLSDSWTVAKISSSRLYFVACRREGSSARGADVAGGIGRVGSGRGEELLALRHAGCTASPSAGMNRIGPGAHAVVPASVAEATDNPPPQPVHEAPVPRATR